MLASLSGVGVEFGGTPILRDVTLTITRGDRWGIVGRNGTGKTTLLKVLAGRLQPSEGTSARASGVRFTLLDQHREFAPDATVWNAAAVPFTEVIALEQSLQRQAERIAELSDAAPPDLLARYDRDLERFAREGGYSYASQVDAVLHGLGFDQLRARVQPVTQLSGGEAGRVALARQLIAPADVLLLDEPTNHLDLDTTRWLEEYLLALDATFLVISHDRAFLERVADHILHVENGTATAYTGSYASFVRQHAERRLSQQRAYDAQRKVIESEQDYIRRNIAGQNSAQAKGRRKRLERVERLTPPPTERSAMALQLDAATRGGDQVVTARDVRVQVGERILLDHFTDRITRGEVIGLVGANGSGKSTLLSVIAGLRGIDGGELRVGDSIRLAYYRQDLAQVPTDKTLFEIIHDLRPQWQRGNVQSHLGRFGFSGDAVQRYAGTLSGGERARVALAMLVLSEANFLLFDEPTNHLDVESIEALEDAIDDFDGTVLLVSHDRALLRNMVSRVWLLENHEIASFNGSFEEWEQWKRERNESVTRAAKEKAALEQEKQRNRDRRAHENSAADRARLRNLRKAVERAEAEVHRHEARLAELDALLADVTLYGTADGARRAGELKVERDQIEARLNAALEVWDQLVSEE